MWHGLFFGLASLFTPQANLPNAALLHDEVRQFAQHFQINTDRIEVRESLLNNPSPFLTSSSTKRCVLHINQHSDAKRVWSHLLNTGEDGIEQAFISFSSGHELTHCLMSEPGKRASTRKALETRLGMQFQNNTHFEETLADLLGLAYLARVDPTGFSPVFNRLKTIRTDFSGHDPEHDSTQALQTAHIEFAESLFIKPGLVELALTEP